MEDESQHSWQGVVRLLPFHCGADEVSLKLFGLAKSVPSDAKALAANRGRPPNPSVEVQREFARIEEHEATHGTGEFGGYTFAEWSEIGAADIRIPEESEWAVVFEIARMLARMTEPEQRIRIVAWYNW